MQTETLLPILLLVFLAIPIMQILRQRKQMKIIQQFQQSLEPGIVVETAGGIQGTVKAVRDTTVVLEISSGVEMTIARNRIIHAISGATTDSANPSVNSTEA